MRLEMRTFNVRDARFASKTQLDGDVLTINREELKALLEEDRNLKRVAVELASPGDDARIIHILDTIEPRCKLSGNGIFPGVLSPPLTVGEGRTNRLAGITVMETATLRPPQTGLLTVNESIVDMSGIGADYSPFSQLHNVVLGFESADELPLTQYEAAIRLAGLKAAVYLAETTKSLEPDELNVYELSATDPRLPKVVYIYFLVSHGFLVDTLLYGKSVAELTPTLIHPNEIMDGAIVSANYGGAGTKNPTYVHLNNPVIRQLYEKHGQVLNFLGIIVSWCAARNLSRAGVREDVAMEITGHKTRSMYRRYRIVDERDLREATEQLQSHLENQDGAKVVALKANQ
jgi:glycine reductase